MSPLLLGAASGWLRRESSAPHDGGPKGSAGIRARIDGLGLLVTSGYNVIEGYRRKLRSQTSENMDDRM